MKVRRRVLQTALRPYCTAVVPGTQRSITIRTEADVAKFVAAVRSANKIPKDRNDSWALKAATRTIMPMKALLPPLTARTTSSYLSSLKPYFGNVRTEDDLAVAS